MRYILVMLFSAVFILAQPAMAATKAAPAEGGNAFEYVELDPLMLPIVDDEGISQVLNLVVSLEVPSVGLADQAKRLRPKLSDAFLMDLYGVLNRNVALKGGVLQVHMIKERLHRVAQDVMGGDEKVHDVLLQVVQQKPI